MYEYVHIDTYEHTKEYIPMQVRIHTSTHKQARTRAYALAN